ncbi:guanylate-binding protein 7-like isoform X2 [Engystomops pustulosus]|uniref:guanylate-binding protein 7-like isoform X2 n=1 Tax=Engystomops pustulosus TaxID=76066 RepID=UPI003AFA27FB
MQCHQNIPLRMPPVLSMPRPLCLIENDGSDLRVNEEAKNILCRISEPVTVVAIVGKYRTGKSFLMNRLAGSNSGFPLGSSVQSKTKGIWMWCRPHPRTPGHVLVLLDTEGLGDVEKGDGRNDSWIFCLAVLLCSSLVYNSFGTIDQQAIEQLHYVTELTKVITLKSSDTRDAAAERKSVLPSFTWCVRDFSLLLERDGRKITEDEYLMMSLELRPGEDFTVYNLPRRCIRSFFHSHKCFVFDRPTSKKNLHRLDEVTENELEPDFLGEAEKFCNYILRSSGTKTLTGGITVTGAMLGHLSSLYVDTIRSGSVPSMDNAVLALAEIENKGALEDALSRYECEMAAHSHTFPTETELEFYLMHWKCRRGAIMVFKARSLNDPDQRYLRELKNQIRKRKEEFMKKNEDLSREVCADLLSCLSISLQDGILEGRYSPPQGQKRFLRDKLQLLEIYNGLPGKGVKSLEALENFLHQHRSTEAVILRAAERTTQAERQMAESQYRAVQAELRRRAAEQQSRDLRRSMITQSAAHQQEISSIAGRMEENRRRTAQETRSLLSHRLQAQESRLSSSYQQSLDHLQSRIEELRRQNRRTEPDNPGAGGGCVLC